MGSGRHAARPKPHSAKTTNEARMRRGASKGWTIAAHRDSTRFARELPRGSGGACHACRYGRLRGGVAIPRDPADPHVRDASPCRRPDQQREQRDVAALVVLALELAGAKRIERGVVLRRDRVALDRGDVRVDLRERRALLEMRDQVRRQEAEDDRDQDADGEARPGSVRPVAAGPAGASSDGREIRAGGACTACTDGREMRPVVAGAGSTGAVSGGMLPFFLAARATSSGARSTWKFASSASGGANMSIGSAAGLAGFAAAAGFGFAAGAGALGGGANASADGVSSWPSTEDSFNSAQSSSAPRLPTCCSPETAA